MSTVSDQDLPVSAREFHQGLRRLEDLMQERTDQGVEAIRHVREIIRDKQELYNERFDAQEKAVAKAEASQKDYNARSNEFRAALDDQGKSMITRSEADQRFEQMHELIDSQAKLIGALQMNMSRGEGKQAVSDPMMTELVQEMRAVRIAQAAGAGKSQGSHAMWGYVVGAVSFIIMLITIATALLKFAK